MIGEGHLLPQGQPNMKTAFRHGRERTRSQVLEAEPQICRQKPEDMSRHKGDTEDLGDIWTVQHETGPPICEPGDQVGTEMQSEIKQTKQKEIKQNAPGHSKSDNDRGN